MVKKNDPTFRIILDVSSPHGESVNDGIDKLEYSVQYQCFDDAVDLVRMPSAVSGFSFAGYALGTLGGRSFSFYIYSFADALAWI